MYGLLFVRNCARVERQTQVTRRDNDAPYRTGLAVSMMAMLFWPLIDSRTHTYFSDSIESVLNEIASGATPQDEIYAHTATARNTGSR